MKRAPNRPQYTRENWHTKKRHPYFGNPHMLKLYSYPWLAMNEGMDAYSSHYSRFNFPFHSFQSLNPVVVSTFPFHSQLTKRPVFSFFRVSGWLYGLYACYIGEYIWYIFEL